MTNHDYFYFKNLYSIEQIKELNFIIASLGNNDNHFDQPTVGKKANIKVFNTDVFGNILNSWKDAVNFANRSHFNFHIFDGFSKFTHINSYSPGDEYPWHRDSKNYGEKFDIKFTSILNISQEEYQGGDFELFLGEGNSGSIHQLHDPGTLLIFPSYLYHRVRPVTQGQRKTMNIWFEGPEFK